jgi:hypothetical protein
VILTAVCLAFFRCPPPPWVAAIVSTRQSWMVTLNNLLRAKLLHLTCNALVANGLPYPHKTGWTFPLQLIGISLLLLGSYHRPILLLSNLDGWLIVIALRRPACPQTDPSLLKRRAQRVQSV